METYKRLTNLLHFIILLSFLFYSSSSAQWTQVKGIDGGEIKTLVNDGTVMYAGASEWGIYVSNDNGYKWEPLGQSRVVGTVVSIVVDGDYIYAGGRWKLYISSDKGKSWRSVEKELGKESVKVFKYKDKIFAYAGKGLYCSYNKGLDWELIDTRINGNSYTSFAYNDSTIIGCFGNKIFYSTDDGTTWILSAGINTYDYIRSVIAVGDNFFVGKEYDGVYISTDQGITWEKTSAPSLSGRNLIVAGELIVDASKTEIFISSDKGKTWSIKNSGLEGLYFTAAGFNGSTLFVSTEYGRIYRSDDLGSTWHQSNSGVALSKVRALKTRGNEVFAGTDIGEIYYSSNNGLTWTKIGSEIGSINAFEVGKYGLLVANGDLSGGLGLQLYVKDDNGWHKEKTVISTTRIYNLNGRGSNIYAASRGVLHSSDFGATWTDYRNEILNHSYSITSVVTIGNYIIAGSNGIGIYRSGNRGLNWELVNYGLEWMPAHMGISDLVVINSRVLAASYNGIYLSTDEGTTWSLSNNGLPSKDVGSLALWGNTIFLGINYYGVYFSNDFGQSWKPFSDGLNNKLINKIAVNNNWLFAATEGNSLWRFPLNTLSAAEENSLIPSDYTLDQNYPNPCNPTSKISFRLPKSTNVKIIVYDIMGREIMKLVDSKLDAGYHEAVFDGTNLASGIYIYRLSTPDFSAARKINLLK